MKKLILFLLFISAQISAMNYKLSICAIFQEEAPYLKEWIEYHLQVGVEHFWLYNNNSSDDYKEVLEPYIANKIIDLIDWNFESVNGKDFFYNVQSPCYTHAINHAKGITKWLAIIDTDEFIVPICNSNVLEILENNFSDCSGVCINWQCYGTSHVTRCNSILNELVYKMRWNHEWNRHSKSIVQPLHVDFCPNPHYCIYLANHWAVDTNRKPVSMCCESVNIDVLRLNHYWTRDENYFWNKKVPRYLKWNGSINGILEFVEQMNYEFDPILREQL